MSTVVDAVVNRLGGPGSLRVLGADGAEHTATWAEIHQRARRLAGAFVPGTRVGLLADTSMDLVVALQAIWLAGAAVTVLPLPTRQSADAYLRHLRGMIEDARPSLVLVGEPFEALAEPLGATDLAAFVAGTGHAVPTPPAPNDLAILQYTSGSTRQPRGVPVSHGQLAANVSAIRVATRHERVHGCLLGWLPLCHDLGLVGGLVLPMSCGCPLVLQSPAAFAARPMSWFEAITAHRATATAAPNFAWGLMARLLAAGGPGIRLDSLRLALTGAEPVDPAVMARFVEVGARFGLDPAAITCAYGLAEATLAVTVSAPGLRVDTVDPVALETRGEAVPTAGGRSLTRLGGPVPGVRLRVVDRDGQELADRRVGRIEVAGASVMRGYWGRPGVAEWLCTGDLGYLADGDLVVCGRESDLVFAAGRNVFPQDIEAAACAVADVRAGNAVAFAAPGLVVVVESRLWGDPEATTALRREVSAAVVAEVGLTPRAVEVLPPGALPKTTSGKVRRAETRRRYLVEVS